MSQQTINARDVAKASRELFARQADAFVNDKEMADDIKIIGVDAAKAILFTQAMPFTPIPEAFEGAPMDYLADRQEIILERENQIGVVFEARKVNQEAVARSKEKALNFLSKMGGGLLSFGASAVMGIVKGGL